jgi:hypothetical protein
MDIEATVIVNSIYSVSEMDYTFEVSFKLVSRESVRARATSFFLFPELFSPARSPLYIFNSGTTSCSPALQMLCWNDPSIFRECNGAKNGIFFWSFPYVCPEPVLAK